MHLCKQENARLAAEVEKLVRVRSKEKKAQENYAMLAFYWLMAFVERLRQPSGRAV